MRRRSGGIIRKRSLSFTPPPRASDVRAAVRLSLDRQKSCRWSSGCHTPRPPPRADEVRAALWRLHDQWHSADPTKRHSSRYSARFSGRGNASLLPPNADAVRAAVQPLTTDGRWGQEPVRGLVPSPKQPDSVVGIVRRASRRDLGLTYRERKRRERRWAMLEEMTIDNNFSLMDSQTDDDPALPPPPPRASAVARAVQKL